MTVLVFLAVSVLCSGQSPTSIVEKYNGLIKGYLNEDDIEKREEIDNLLRGGTNKCYISNKVALDMAHERHIEVGQMHSDSYHNILQNWYESGLINTLEINQIQWQKEWHEPRIKLSSNEAPVHFVSAHLSMGGSKNYEVSDLYLVQSGHIVGIGDMGEGGLGNALALYNKGRYEEAFNIFRKIALTNRNAYNARYYTAVMLIKGEGCKHIAKQVRDQDAAWLGLSGYFSGDEELSGLALKFSMSLPFHESLLKNLPPSHNGRRIVKKGTSKFGIMDDSGKYILPMHSGYAGQFTCSGITWAKQSTQGKFGLIDTDGILVLPYEYDEILPYFYDDKIAAIKGGNLMILDKAGNVVKSIEGSFSTMSLSTAEGWFLLKDGPKNVFYNYDGELVMDADKFDRININHRTGEVNICVNTTPIRTLFQRW